MERYVIEENHKHAPWEVIFKSKYFDLAIARLDEYGEAGREVRMRNTETGTLFRPYPQRRNR